MYSLKSLQQKNLKELKEIGFELNVLAAGDRRCRQNWIDALAGVQPPLLQLLEVSSAVEVEAVEEAIEIQRQEPIGVQAQEPIETPETQFKFDCPTCKAVGSLYIDRDCCLETWVIRCLHCNYDRFMNRSASYLSVPDPALDLFDIFPFKVDLLRKLEAQDSKVQATEPINSRDGLVRLSAPTTVKQIEIQRQEPIESKFGRIVYPRAQKPIAQTEINATISDVESRPASADLHNSRTPTAEPDGGSSSDEAEALGSQKGDRVLALAGNSEGDKGRALFGQSDELTAAKTPSGVSSKTSTAHQLLELFKSKAHVVEDSPAGKTEPKVSQSAIAPATKNLLDAEEVDPTPILTGVTFSDNFLARYSPPQPEIFHYQADADGQLSLLNFEVERHDEPPDPDDFESLDAFRQAIARWDAEHSEPLEVSLDSFCEWAPCPLDWYEPTDAESSSTCNFFIPTFDDWCDRLHDTDEPPSPEDFDSMFAFWAAYDAWIGEDDDTDEPPDTGIFARLPGPKPPSFPPMIVGRCDRASRIRKFARGAILAIGRSPPGGDAGF
ncbi:hypothetical protein QUA56_08140 [Microcoleus sp. N3A4]|uniref:hypothetical protein n=1 Tax=Microcoleus sp. N3A4 TaxID=3055379 RepID=UPI002FD46080